MESNYSPLYLEPPKPIYPLTIQDANYSFNSISSSQIINNKILENQYSNLLSILSNIQSNQSLLLKRNSIIQTKKFPRYLIQSEVIDYLGKEWIYKILCNEWGLEAVHSKHKGKLFCSKHVEDVCIQFEKNIIL
jgi:hypothetical protein